MEKFNQKNIKAMKELGTEIIKNIKLIILEIYKSFFTKRKL
tara:strand:- start:1221 stop:1343 length:123 start_codon:yes stop_codon:yes gene_type:complete